MKLIIHYINSDNRLGQEESNTLSEVLAKVKDLNILNLNLW